MSNFSRQNLVMPKIARSLTMKRSSMNEQKYYSGKDFNYHQNRKSLNMKFNFDNTKKPGTSIEKIKPINIFPIIGPMKIPSSKRCHILSEDELTSQILSKISVSRKPFQEVNKEEMIKFHKSNTINNNTSKNEEKPTIIKLEINDLKENEKNKQEEKKPKNIIDINKYKDICINILTNNNDLNKMFQEIYDNKINCKKWVESTLFGKEIFKVRLESYIKSKTDVLSFIKKEIEKLLNNEYCDFLFNKSVKQVDEEYNEHIKYIESY